MLLSVRRADLSFFPSKLSLRAASRSAPADQMSRCMRCLARVYRSSDAVRPRRAGQQGRSARCFECMHRTARCFELEALRAVISISTGTLAGSHLRVVPTNFTLCRPGRLADQLFLLAWTTWFLPCEPAGSVFLRAGHPHQSRPSSSRQKFAAHSNRKRLNFLQRMVLDARREHFW